MKNHFIPCFYTKRWVGNDRRLVKFSRPSNLLIDRRRFPSQVGYATDLYTLPGIEDETRYLLETEFFFILDQLASNALSKLESIGAAALTEKDRLAWIAFLISLKQRNPERLLRFAQQVDKRFRSEIEDYKHEYYCRREDGNDKPFEQFIDDMERDMWFDRTKKLLLRDIILLPQTTAVIQSFAWDVLTFDSPEEELLTSDRPVIMIDGLDPIDGHIALPVGPRKLFIAARDKDVMRDIKNTPKLVRAVNEIVVRQAYAEVYGTGCMQRAFIDARFCLVNKRPLREL